MAEVKIIPSAQPVKSGPRPTFNNPGEFVKPIPAQGEQFPPSRVPQPEQARR